MSERWIRDSEKILKQIEKLEKIKERDRLELVRPTCFMLGALERSLIGWMQWVGNLTSCQVQPRRAEGDKQQHLKVCAVFHRIRHRSHQTGSPEGTKSQEENN